METVGIICEYNPLHLGHLKQMELIRRRLGPETAIVCLMSGNFVQRGAPAILDKSLRARAAVCCGADLVLELPLEVSLSSAEGFAAGGVGILGDFCDYLCFGAELSDGAALMATARAMLSEGFSPLLRSELERGVSFPAARQAALESMGLDGTVLEQPNNILAVEYCKAMLAQDTQMQPLPILREGNYHAQLPDSENPSATALRRLMIDGGHWQPYVPEVCRDIFAGAVLHTLEAGERAVLGKLRTMEDEEFEALPYGSEGLWRKLMHASRSCATLEQVASAVKSKRYTRSRIDRMILCAFLGLSRIDLTTPAPYTRVLAFTDRGRTVLKKARKHGAFPNAGEVDRSSYSVRERKTGDLYGLFAREMPSAPGCEASRRVYYHKGTL